MGVALGDTSHQPCGHARILAKERTRNTSPRSKPRARRLPDPRCLAAQVHRDTTANGRARIYALTAVADDTYDLARELGAKEVFVKAEAFAAPMAEAIQRDLGL